MQTMLSGRKIDLTPCLSGAIAFLIFAPMLDLLYAITFPSAPVLAIDLPNRAFNGLLFLYFLLPLMGFVIVRRVEDCFWLPLALVCTPLSLIWLVSTWQITDDYVSPEWVLNRTVVKRNGYAVKVYDSYSESFLRQEWGSGALKLVQDIHSPNRIIDIEIVSNKEVRCTDESGNISLVNIAGK